MKKKVVNLEKFSTKNIEILSAKQSFAVQGGKKTSGRVKSAPAKCSPDGTCTVYGPVEDDGYYSDTAK